MNSALPASDASGTGTPIFHLCVLDLLPTRSTSLTFHSVMRMLQISMKPNGLEEAVLSRAHPGPPNGSAVKIVFKIQNTRESVGFLMIQFRTPGFSVHTEVWVLGIIIGPTHQAQQLQRAGGQQTKCKWAAATKMEVHANLHLTLISFSMAMSVEGFSCHPPT